MNNKKKNDWEWNLDDDYLAHYGVLGMKWGIRRYQNRDGSLTTFGKARIRMDSKYKDKYVAKRDKYSKKAAKLIKKADHQQKMATLMSWNEFGREHQKKADRYVTKYMLAVSRASRMDVELNEASRAPTAAVQDAMEKLKARQV